MPSVTFAPSVNEKRPSQKRRRDPNSMVVAASAEGSEQDASEDSPRKQKRYRPNEDELDDVDDWQEGDDNNVDDVVPSEKELLEAKRQRRQNRSGLDQDEKTRIDDVTSLASEDVAIEPFHMRNEESDGTGFFDGDTYVFRRKNTEEGEDQEPDAWLDRLREDEEEGKSSLYKIAAEMDKKLTSETAQESMDDLTKEELYLKIWPLLNEQESVSQALIRYGRLIKSARGRKVPKADLMQATTQDPAKVYLNDLTGAANALLLKGEVEIYQSTKQDIRRHLPSSGFDSASTAKRLIEKQPPAKWEYMGNQDGAIHGPYTTEQMMAWVRAGYFVGAQRVKIRTIRDEAKEKTNQDDLLADLLEDDDEGGTDENKTETARGDWQWSNGIDFGAYLPEPNC